MDKINNYKKNQGALAIFVKTPGLSPIKTRLAAAIGKDKAEEFFGICVKIVAEIAATTAEELKPMLQPYWAVAEKPGLNHPLWKDFPAIHTGPGGLGLRLHHIYTTLLKKHAYVILIGADIPTLTSQIIIDAIEKIQHRNQFVIGPSHDGGFYLFAGNKSIPKNIWQSVTYSNDTTLTQLTEKLATLGNIEFLSPLRDIDNFDDLLFTKKEITKTLATLPVTTAATSLFFLISNFHTK